MTINLLSLPEVSGKISGLSPKSSLKPDSLVPEEPTTFSFSQLLAPKLSVKTLSSPKPVKEEESCDIGEHPVPLSANSPHPFLTSSSIQPDDRMLKTIASDKTTDDSFKTDARTTSLRGQALLPSVPLTTQTNRLSERDPRLSAPISEARSGLGVSLPPTTIPFNLGSAAQALVTQSLPVSEASSGQQNLSLISLTAQTSQTSLTDTTEPARPMQELRAPLGTPQWQRDLSQQIIFHKQGEQTVHLTLHPKELGELTLSLTINQDQAELMMLSSHGQVRTALEAALPQLRQALADNGIQLAHSHVGQESSSGHSSYTPADQRPSPTHLPEASSEVDISSVTAEHPSHPLRDGRQISLLV